MIQKSIFFSEDGDVSGGNIGKAIEEYLCTSTKTQVKSGNKVTDRKNEKDIVATIDNTMVWSDWPNFKVLIDKKYLNVDYLYNTHFV